MKKVLIGILCTFVSFILFMLGLMKFLPVFIGGLFMFLSIFFTVLSFSERKRFKGIHS
ncbi:hypothetical protein SAMN05192534_11014 [Alteribacillus persepolensis]|uniref:Uncharacterized protein n=1 Tax=Alteribacillus persepolensis TaxID=568899 RepID=A0A1G8EQ98_9BACI|nr:hypothetical protein [Alteribacillus persepolensis]SDH71889.1 hypothetical protein SAMN05192534_11014 [Alteribacillus persepolensis]